MDLFVPKAGQGPSKKQRENGFFNLKFYFNNGGQKYIAKVTGDMDPGYGSTSKMLAECAICLALDDTLNENYGVITPSVAFEKNILERLQNKIKLTAENSVWRLYDDEIKLIEDGEINNTIILKKVF